MTSNVQWSNQYEGNYSGAGDNSNAWNRPLVNTPQTNPASWPQLGASSAETEQAPPAQPPPPQPEEGNWNASSNNATNNSESSSSAWVRSQDNGSKPKQAATGWGTPSSGPSWGQATTVDNGTAVWGKSSTQQPQAGWGGQPQPTQGNEGSVSTTGWGTPNTTAPAVSPANGTDSQAQPPSTSSSSANSSSQPVSWAKAASANLPASNSSGSDSAPAAHTENEQEPVENNAIASTPVSTNVETDPVQKLVNSHEGWGKKPIQQGTSWNISDSGPAFNRPQVSNGTEAWGRHSGGPGGQSAGPGWGDSANNKPAAGSGWGGAPGATSPNFQQSASGQPWGGAQQQQPQQQQQQQPQQQPPPQQQAARPFMAGNGPNTGSGWGNQPQNPNGRWNDMANQGGGGGGAGAGANSGNWGGPPPVPQQQTGGPRWSASQSGGGNASGGWGGGQQGPGNQGSGWSGNMVQQQTPTIDPTTWNQPAEAGVDNGTAAWGDPGTYTKVNMWDKREKPGANNEAAAGQMPSVNNQVKTTGWGAPNPTANRPPSPKGWGDVSPTRTNPIDKGTASWGQKPMVNEKWDKGGNGGNNWNAMKPTSGGSWGQQPSDSQWGASDNGPNWGQMDGGMKGNMDFGPRGMMPSLNMPQQQMMLRNQTPPNVSNVSPQPQFQNQIRHAVMNGIVPPQVLNPQLMTPQHMQNIMQLIAKTTEVQKIQAKLNTLMNPNNKAMPMPNMVRQQQIEQCARAMRQNQQQLEVLRSMIIQTMLQKAQSNPANKMNNPMNAGGMDMGRMRSGSSNQPMVSSLNNMNPMMQALPNPGMSSLTSPTGREESRFASSWKQPNTFGSMGDNMMQPNISHMGLGMGPGGDSAFNGSAFRSHEDINEVRNLPDPGAQMAKDNHQAAVEASVALADIGPPEFTPGVPWKGFRHIDPEADPNITPGSVAIAKTMSLNTVNADQVLNRDRSAPESSTASNNAPREQPNIPAQIWSSAGTEGNNWSGPSPDTRGSWLVLTNFNQQVDPAYVQSLCAQHGTVASFQPHYPMEGTALVKYNTPDEALKAKNALNMSMVGSTMLVATVATDQDVSNFMTARAGGSWSSNLSSRFSGSNAYPNRDATALPSSAPQQPFWGGNPSSNVGPGNASYNNLSWSRSTGEEQGRVTSPMHSLLPENLLGGETM